MEYSSAAGQSHPMLAWTDRLKLDVTVSQGAEIFSWAGAQAFPSEDVEKIAGSGMTGTGDFGPFLMCPLAGDASESTYLGLVMQDKGHSFALYRYQLRLCTDANAVLPG
jgi:hypothetical protein